LLLIKAKDANLPAIEKSETSSHAFSEEQVREHVRHVCDSAEFRGKKTLCQLLTYLIEETLAGRAEDIKGYSIAVDVFDKDHTFNPDLNPLVRINVGRLRRSLELYYSRAEDMPFRIVIPIGNYATQFLPMHSSAETAEAQPDSFYDAVPLDRPVIAVLPFHNLTGDPNQDYFVQGFAEELSIELSRYQDFKILGYHAGTLKNGDAGDERTRVDAHFAIEGAIRKDEDTVKISIKTFDVATGEQIWGEHFRRKLTDSSLMLIQEEIIAQAVAKLISEYGIVPHALSKESKARRTKDPSVYDAKLRFYYHLTQHTPESHKAAFYALEMAVQKDPENGTAAAMLADLYATRYMLDLPQSEGALEKAAKMVKKACALDPFNQLIRIVSATIYFYKDQKELFFQEMDKALDLNPNSPMHVGSIGFFLSLYGDWERGNALLEKAMSQNAAYPLYYHGVTCLYNYRLNRYDAAYEEACKYAVPGLFWGPMLRVACLGQLNEPEKAKKHIADLANLKPDFPEKANMLIRRYIKEDELVALVENGLVKAGMTL
jgi:adenylate cyclase